MNKSKLIRLAQFVIRITVIIILFGGSTTNRGVISAQAAALARFHVQMVENNVQGYDWPVGTTVTLTIDDPNTVGVDFTDTKTAISDPLSWDPDFTVVSFDDLGGITLAPGMLITMTNDTISKYHTVTDIEVAGVDLGEDTVWGTGTPGANINVQYCDDSSGCVWRRWATVQPDGTWQADFSIAGPGDDEQLILDILPGIIGEALEPDGDGDHTDYQWGVDWVAPPSIPLVFAISSPVDISVPRATLENISVLNALNDSLFRLDQDANLQPLAASSYSVSQNGLVYTVTLRSGAVWTDGQPVTAQNYVDGILRVLDPEVGSDYGFLLFPIVNAEEFNNGSLTNRNLVGVKALNSLTLEFTIKQPATHFPQILASPVMLPARQDVIDQYGVNWTSPAHFVSNGLYKLAEYDAGHIVIEKNLLYNGPVQAVFSQIGFDVIPDPANQVAAYKNSSVDVLLSTPISTITADPILKKDLNAMPSPGVQYINFFTPVTPMNNPLVRKALASAVDRQILIDNILMTPWRVEATGVIPPELEGYQGSAVGYSYDPHRAQSFLTQAGYPGGAGLPTLNFFVVSPGQAAIVGEIASQWETVLGIAINIDTITVEERGTVLANCQASPSTCPYDGYLTGWLVDYPDAYNVLNDLFSPDSPYNHTQWDNTQYRELLDLAVSEADPMQRISDLQQAEKILVQDDVAVMPLYHLDSAVVVRPGIYPYYSTMYFSNLAYWSDVDPVGDGVAAEVIGASGGTVATEDTTVSVNVPAGALQEEVTLSVTDLGGNYQITTSQEPLDVLSSFNIQPHGLQFDVPVALTFAWNDTDDDGRVDETTQPEANIFLVKDGEPITEACGINPDCDMSANLLSVEVTSLSHFELVIDSISPVISSITLASPNPTSATNVSFLVIFSEPVTDVDAGDLTLMLTGITGATITNISGSGTEYTVTVNTGSGNGTIRLDVVDDDSIRDAANNPLGGAGAGNGNYTNGQVYNITKTNGAGTTGVFRPSNGLLYLKNSNDTGFADAALNYGLPGDYPVVGDWDGNGTVTIGIYRGKTFYLRNENTNGFATIVFDFGQAGDQPIAGDWDGDGIDTIGIYRPSNGQFLLRNSNDAGPAEMSFYLGNVGDVGIAGDWNGDGKDTTGVFRPSNGVIFLKDTNDTGFADYALNYGLPGDRPVMGDWDNDGIDTIGIYRSGTFYLRNENTNGFATIVFGLGNPGDMPIAGNWDGIP